MNLANLGNMHEALLKTPGGLRQDAQIQSRGAETDSRRPDQFECLQDLEAIEQNAGARLATVDIRGATTTQHSHDMHVLFLPAIAGFVKPKNRLSTAVERAMKVEEVILRAMAKMINWWPAELILSKAEVG